MKTVLCGLACLLCGLASITIAAAYTFTRSGETLCVLFLALALLMGWQAMKNGNGN